MREIRTKSPYLPCKVTLPQLFTSFWINLCSSLKWETDVLEITTVLPASNSLFGSRLIFKQSNLTRSDYILNFNEMATEKPRTRKPRNSLCKQLTVRRRRSTIPPFFVFVFCFYVNDWRISGLQSSFLIQQHEEDVILKKKKIELQMQEFPCLCVHFRPINGTVESQRGTPRKIDWWPKSVIFLTLFMTWPKVWYPIYDLTLKVNLTPKIFLVANK